VAEAAVLAAMRPAEAAKYTIDVLSDDEEEMYNFALMKQLFEKSDKVRQRN
jgi:hypothetical protein